VNCAVIAGLFALAFLLVWQKHRGTWSEIFRLRREPASMRGEIVAARVERIRVEHNVSYTPREVGWRT
jgi:hypothetical protein